MYGFQAKEDFYIFLNSWEKKQRTIFSDMWNSNVNVPNKVWLGHSHAHPKSKAAFAPQGQSWIAATEVIGPAKMK